MSIQLNKEEKKIYMQTIDEEYNKREIKTVSILRIIWEIHKKGFQRHTFVEMRRLVEPRLKQHHKDMRKKLLQRG